MFTESLTPRPELENDQDPKRTLVAASRKPDPRLLGIVSFVSVVDYTRFTCDRPKERRRVERWRINELFEKGLKTRRQVLGAKYVDANLAGSDEFMMTFQRAVTELAWGYAWSRPGLDRKTRSILTLGILAGLGRFQELGIYTNAAVASGVTIDEITEALVQITVYCGTPAGRQAFLAAHEALNSQRTKRRIDARTIKMQLLTRPHVNARLSPITTR